MKEKAKQFLLKIIGLYDRRLIQTDPVSFPHRYPDWHDRELVSFLAAEFAFGNAQSLMASIEKLLQILGPRPHQFLTEARERQLDKIDHSGHRWIRGHHLIQLLKLLRSVYQGEGSLEKLFLKGYSQEDQAVGPALQYFTRSFLENPPQPPFFKGGSTKLSPPLAKGGKGGFGYFFPSPKTGSACKRLNMFLRWMIRPADGIDLGLWKGIAPSKLVIPLDTHLYQFARKFKITRRKTPDWKMARETTDFLKELAPEDPLKFDFAICHYGMERGWD
ncbi:MAG: TIGR02757 family protein [Deltaproteobacteria bacterium]|nr:TIGR02757 family protein [Deltaproteobacteria bacterium]